MSVEGEMQHPIAQVRMIQHRKALNLAVNLSNQNREHGTFMRRFSNQWMDGYFKIDRLFTDAIWKIAIALQHEAEEIEGQSIKGNDHDFGKMA